MNDAVFFHYTFRCGSIILGTRHVLLKGTRSLSLNILHLKKLITFLTKSSVLSLPTFSKSIQYAPSRMQKRLKQVKSQYTNLQTDKQTDKPSKKSITTSD